MSITTAGSRSSRPASSSRISKPFGDGIETSRRRRSGSCSRAHGHDLVRLGRALDAPVAAPFEDPNEQAGRSARRRRRRRRYTCPVGSSVTPTHFTAAKRLEFRPRLHDRGYWNEQRVRDRWRTGRAAAHGRAACRSFAVHSRAGLVAARSRRATTRRVPWCSARISSRAGTAPGRPDGAGSCRWPGLLAYGIMALLGSALSVAALLVMGESPSFLPLALAAVRGMGGAGRSRIRSSALHPDQGRRDRLAEVGAAAAGGARP